MIKSISNILLKIRNKEHNNFDNFILIIILISAVLIGLETEPWLVNQFHYQFHIADIIILGIFIFEIIFKMIAQGLKPWKYFHDPWNLFDFIIVILSFLPYIVTHGQDDTHAFAAFRVIRLVRAVRVFRVFRVITHIKHLQILVETLIKSLPSLMYVIILLGIFFYIYSVIGVFLFGQYDQNHFGNLQSALLTMFECIAGSWTDIVDNLYQFKDMPHPWVIPYFFISFYFLAGLIILNLFIGIIVSELSSVKEAKIIAEIREGFIDDLDKESSNLLKKLEYQINDANSTLKALQISFDKNKEKS
jgi:voltage-gated sodium channel